MSFTLGHLVYGQWLMSNGRHAWFKGTLTGISSRGSFCDILYEDGDTELHKPIREVRERREATRVRTPPTQFGAQAAAPKKKRAPKAAPKKRASPKRGPKAQRPGNLIPLYYKNYLLKRFTFVDDRTVLLEFYGKPPAQIRMSEK
jgi:hypothetical protein